jgi:quercetin dioxygenase-like cupin family protein
MSVVKPSRDLPMDPVGAGRGTFHQVLTLRGSGQGFHMRRFVMEPGGGMPLHRNAVEHQQYVLQGQARVTVGDRVHEVEKGDVLHIPAGTPHAYKAQGDEPFEFLCVVPDDDDRIEILE